MQTDSQERAAWTSTTGVSRAWYTLTPRMKSSRLRPWRRSAPSMWAATVRRAGRPRRPLPEFIWAGASPTMETCKTSTPAAAATAWRNWACDILNWAAVSGSVTLTRTALV